MAINKAFAAAVITFSISAPAVLTGLAIGELANRGDHAGPLEPIREWAQSENVKSYANDRNGLIVPIVMLWPFALGSAYYLSISAGLRPSGGKRSRIDELPVPRKQPSPRMD